MPLELNKIAEQSRELWKRLPPKRRLGLVGAVAATLGLIGFLSLRPQTETYAVLYSGLTAEDAGHVVEYLKAQAVPYKVENGGATIEVPATKVHEVRITMASSGLPRGGGVGYEVFDKQTFGTTSFVEQMNYRRALQGELARTVMSLDAVEKARVHIAMRERSLFRDEDEPPSASVVLQLRPGKRLSPVQVRGVVHLVAASIEGLQPDRITIVDESGAALWSGDESVAGVENQRELERTLSRRITEMVDRVVGVGHSAVAVTAELDFARTERTEELYEKDKEALRSVARTEEKSTNGDTQNGGVAGARGNLPGAPSAPADDSASDGSSSSKSSETRNYEVPRIISKTVGPKVRIKKLHVAVLVDNVAVKGGKPVPRTEEELAQITSLAREAAGLDIERGDKIEVHTAPFATSVDDSDLIAPVAVTSPWPLNLPKKTMAIGGGVTAALLLILAFAGFVAFRRRPEDREHNELPLLPVTVGELEAALPDHHQLPASSPHGLPEGISIRERALEAARADSARAARVVASWLAENQHQQSHEEGGRL